VNSSRTGGRDTPALLDKFAQRLLPDVLGKFLSDYSGRYLALAEARQAGALLVDLGRAVFRRLHALGRDTNLERRLTGLRAGFLYENVWHAWNNLT
jgi:hypothetical protein